MKGSDDTLVFRTRSRTIATLSALAFGAAPVSAQTPQTFFPCYVPAVGAIYMIKLPGLPQACLSAAHQPISWREGATGPAGGDLSGTFPTPTVTGLRGRPMASTAPAAGQILMFDGTNWVPAAPVSGSSGAAGGDLAGAYPNPSVAKLRGNGLSSTTPAVGQALVFDGTNWTPTTIITAVTGTASGDLSGSYPSPTVVRLQGRGVASTPPANGQVLSFNGTNWVPSTPATGASGTAGGDLSGTYPNPVVSALQGQAVSLTPPTTGQLLGFSGTTWGPTSPPTASGTAGGDLSGTFPNPSVVQLRGTSVAATAPSTGQVLTYSGAAWAPSLPKIAGHARVLGQVLSIIDGASASDVVSCPAGTIILSGGWLVVSGNPLGLKAAEFGPSSTTTWSVTLSNSAPGTVQVQAVALCAS